jgi:hypothetical protein
MVTTIYNADSPTNVRRMYQGYLHPVYREASRQKAAIPRSKDILNNDPIFFLSFRSTHHLILDIDLFKLTPILSTSRLGNSS